MRGTDEVAATPREAFSLLGHEVRLEILLALLDGWAAAQTEPRRYSELMRAIGMEDSGKFNYHLGRLRGAYLRKTEAGYVPTASATALYRAVLAHRPTVEADRTELTPGVDCPDCGEPLVGIHEGGFFTLRCRACEGVVDGFTYPLPKNALDGRTDEAVLRVVNRRGRSQIGLARTGQCPDCVGRTTVTVRADDAGTDEQPVGIACDTRSWHVRTGYLLPLLADPRVTRALSGVGLPVTETYPWALPTPTATVTGTDPYRLDLRIEGDGGTVTLTVDDELGLRDIVSSPAGDRQEE
jgi:DNA-binding transcriptional ArsR family regulator